MLCQQSTWTTQRSPLMGISYAASSSPRWSWTSSFPRSDRAVGIKTQPRTTTLLLFPMPSRIPIPPYTPCTTAVFTLLAPSKLKHKFRQRALGDLKQQSNSLFNSNRLAYQVSRGAGSARLDARLLHPGGCMLSNGLRERPGAAQRTKTRACAHRFAL